MGKVKFNFYPEKESANLQWGVSNERVDELMKPTLKKFLKKAIEDNSEEGIDIGVAIKEAIEPCETVEEIIFVTYGITKFMDHLKNNPMMTAPGALHSMFSEK